MVQHDEVRIEQASETDLPLILEFVRELAAYEKLAETVTVNEERLLKALFGPQSVAEAIIAYQHDLPIAFAIYYFNYSSFSGLPGLYLEDIFVRPHARGSGIGLQIFRWLASKAMERGCGRMEWAVLDWNESAIKFYQQRRAEPVEGWTVFRLSQNQLKDLAHETS
jgi:GNAT superfamily N-acetyltransferase